MHDAMSKIGRNDPCPSGAEVKFKKCLLRHPDLGSGAAAPDVWWVCDRWTAAAPACPDLLEALDRARNVSVDRLNDFLNRVLELPSEDATMKWVRVFTSFAQKGYPDLQGLYRRIISKLPDAPASFYADLAEEALEVAPALLPEIINDCLKLDDAAVDNDTAYSLCQLARRAGLSEQTTQLQARFPDLVPKDQPVKSSRAGAGEPPQADVAARPAAKARDEDLDLDEGVSEEPLPPELAARANQLWKGFAATKSPSAEQMDAHLTNLLALPLEATNWGEVLRRFARLGHADLPAVFRRIALAVPHVRPNGMSWFYWGAAEDFTLRRRSEMLPEIAAGFQKLDLASYNPDALGHLLDYLLGYGYETAALTLAEHFLPIQREDTNLLEWVVPECCRLIYSLRLGHQFRSLTAGLTVDAMAQQLRQGLEEGVAEDAARLGAEIACQHAPEPTWNRNCFDLLRDSPDPTKPSRPAQLRIVAAQMWVAKEGYDADHAPAGCTLYGLQRIQFSADRMEEDERKPLANLIDCLRADTLEPVIAKGAWDVVNLNVPQARLMLAAMAQLARFALRHELIRPNYAAAIDKELTRIAARLEPPDTGQPNDRRL
jgi:hypothetical protein